MNTKTYNVSSLSFEIINDDKLGKKPLGSSTASENAEVSLARR